MREDRGPHLRLAQGPQELNPALIEVVYGLSIVTKISDLNDLERDNFHDLRYFAEFGSFHGPIT